MRIRKREIVLLLFNTILSFINLYFCINQDYRSSNFILTLMYAIATTVTVLILVDNDGNIE